MSIIVILLILFGIFAFVIFFKLIKNVVKALFYVFGLIAFILLIIGLIVLVDANNFKKEFQQGTAKYLLVDGEEVLAATVIDGKNLKLQTLTGTQTEADELFWQNNDTEQLRGNHYKLFIIEKSVLDEIDERIEYGEYNFSSQRLLEIIQDEDPINALAGDIAVSLDAPQEMVAQQLNARYADAGELRSELFAAELTLLFPTRLDLVMSHLKDGSIQIYEESMLFKTLKYVPASFIKSALGKINAGEVSP